MRLSMRLPVPADNRLGIYLERVSRSSYATGGLIEAPAVVEPSGATRHCRQISRRLCRCLTYQLSGRPRAHEYAPHVRSRSESARLRLTRAGHGPLQRKLDPLAATARPPVATPSAAYGLQPAPGAGERSRHGIAAALIEADLNMPMSMRLPVPADNRLGVYLGHVSS